MTPCPTTLDRSADPLSVNAVVSPLFTSPIASLSTTGTSSTIDSPSAHPSTLAFSRP